MNPIQFTVENVMSFSDFTLAQILGHGRTAIVYHGTITADNPWQLDEQQIAIKEIDSMIDSATHSWEVERTHLSLCQHPRIIRLIGFAEDNENDRLYLVFPFIQGGSLEDRISQDWTWPNAIRLLIDIASGLNYLHTRNPPIIHADLKPEDILLEGENAIICDFGTADQVGRPHIHGTLGYADLYSSGEMQCATDVFSFGIITMKLLTGWNVIQDGRHIYFIFVDGLHVIRPSLTNSGCRGKVAKKIVKLALKCSRPQLNKRPTAAKLVEKLEGFQQSTTQKFTKKLKKLLK